MSTQVVRPLHAERLEIRCNVGDAIVANLGIHSTSSSSGASTRGCSASHSHTRSRIFRSSPGRMAIVDGTVRLRCEGQGVPFTSVSSGRTLREAIRSASQDSGLWLVEPGERPHHPDGGSVHCARYGSHNSRTTRPRSAVSWHHMIGDMQTFMHLMNAWSAAAAGRPLAEPLIVEDRAAYLDEHLPADGAREPGVRFLGLANLPAARCTWQRMRASSGP